MSEKNPAFFHKDYEIIKHDVLYEGIFRLARYHVRHRLFKEGWSEVFIREVLERLSAVAILPYDPQLDQVVLIEQFRIGAITHPTTPWLIEIVAGCIEGNHNPSETAQREAEEEAGCHIEKLHFLYDYFVSPGGSNEYLHLFCGKVDASNVRGIHGLKEEDEDIRAFAIPAEEAFEEVRQGKIKTAPAIMALQWLQLNREWLRSVW
jgi:ADP-ribose pyrophosphatase